MRDCKATTRKGKPCKAHPLHGSDFCMAHTSKEQRESAGFGGSQPNAGRKPVPKPTEVARRLVEENIAAVQRPYWRTLGYDVEIGPDGPYVVKLEGGGAKLYGVSAKDGYVFVSEHDDLGAMMNASEKLQDRSFGRPKQQTEISGPGGGAITTVNIGGDIEHKAEVVRILDQAHAVAVNGNGSNGKRNGHR